MLYMVLPLMCLNIAVHTYIFLKHSLIKILFAVIIYPMHITCLDNVIHVLITLTTILVHRMTCDGKKRVPQIQQISGKEIINCEHETFRCYFLLNLKFASPFIIIQFK
jgi:hypothetical protein